MSASSPRVLQKAILVPSGDHTGPESTAGSSVSCSKPEPSALITQMSSSPSRLLTNAILWLSGDHDGQVSLAG